jgi:hypothetical protein
VERKPAEVSFEFCLQRRGRIHSNARTWLDEAGSESHEAEGHLLRNFKKYADREGSSHQSIWNWLALAPASWYLHAFLDWTYSPYVALHFATVDSDLFSKDILCIDYHRTNESLPSKLRQILKEEGSYVFTAEMLDKAAGSLAEFASLSSHEFVLFFEPPTLDERS